MHLFYTPNVQPPTYTLPEDESKHCIRVLRLSINDSIVLIDGIGGWYEAKIIDDNAKRCQVEITNSIANYGKQKTELHIAIAPTKNNDRTEWFVEKATEIGIHTITPIKCTNSERTVIKNERLIKVAVAAMKQSLKAYLPTIAEMQNVAELISKLKNEAKVI